MPRPCTICQDPRLPEISVDMANGVSDVADRQALRPGAFVRAAASHARRPPPGRQNCRRRRPPLNSVDAARRTGRAFAALASLPSADEVGAAYSSIGARIDAIAAKAESDGSLAVALMGLKELRATVTAQAQLAGHVGTAPPVAGQHPSQRRPWRGGAEIIAALRPPLDAAIPPELAIHLGRRRCERGSPRSTGGGHRWRVTPPARSPAGRCTRSPRRRGAGVS